MRAEQAYIILTTDGPIFVYAMEAEDCERAEDAYRHSKHPVDIEAIEVMRECLGQSIRLSPIYDVVI